MFEVSHRRASAGTVLLGLVAILAVTGCSELGPTPDNEFGPTPSSTPLESAPPEPAPSEDAGGNVNNSASYREYLAAAEEYEDQLPEGYVFPADYPQGNPSMAPKGTGTGAALYYWRCAWTDKFLKDFDAGDQKAIDRDLDTLDTWQDFTWVIDNGVLDGSSWTEDVIAPAREGHISVLRTLGYGGCDEVEMAQTEPTPAANT